MAKVDPKRVLDGYRARVGEFRTIDVPSLRYLMVDGRGDPNTAPDYAEALAAIYPVAYAAKFASKRDLDRDYVVPPLEALWWADDMEAFTSRRDKLRWSWTVIVLVPDWVTDSAIEASISQVAAKQAPVALDRVRLELLDEGTCVQTLHIGSYDDEAHVLEHLHQVVIPAAGPVMTGRHHEIYLSDPRRVEPAKLRTILRQPVKPGSNNVPLGA